jgi:hypothetical protein
MNEQDKHIVWQNAYTYSVKTGGTQSYHCGLIGLTTPIARRDIKNRPVVTDIPAFN